VIPRDSKKSIEVKLSGPTAKFLKRNYHSYNAKYVRDATYAYKHLLDQGGKMFVAIAGAMSTARVGISLAAMIRAGFVSGLSVTGANLEEDVFNLVGRDDYLDIPDYKDTTPEDDEKLGKKKFVRIYEDVVPPEVMKKVEDAIITKWKNAKLGNERKFPHEYLCELLLDGALKSFYQIDPAESWLLAAAEMKIPIVTPGWEDSTLGNVFTALVREMEVDVHIMKTGIEAMNYLADWYLREKAEKGFFQIGGGIAGDFPICVVPFLKQDCHMGDKVKHWAYFCQITDAEVSYGGYSGAEPNEKITWNKISKKTPKFVIKSDATIVVPLMFDAILGI
jgi:deoxyhypusine synthase